MASEETDEQNNWVHRLPERDAFVELLLWYGVLGVVRLSGDTTYIYDVNYDMGRLRGIIEKLAETEVVYAINPAFVPALEIELSN